MKLQSECEKQELLIEQKDEEIELLKQQQTESTTMLNELKLVLNLFVYLHDLPKFAGFKKLIENRKG